MSRADCQIGGTDFRSLIEDSAPMRPAVNGFVDATLLARTVYMSQYRDVDYGRILGINDDAADVTCVLQAHVVPGSTGIGRLVDSVSEGQGGTDVRLAGPDINRVRI